MNCSHTLVKKLLVELLVLWKTGTKICSFCCAIVANILELLSTLLYLVLCVLLNIERKLVTIFMGWSLFYTEPERKRGGANTQCDEITKNRRCSLLAA